VTPSSGHKESTPPMPTQDDSAADMFRMQDSLAREDPENRSSPEWVKAQLSWRERQLATSTVVQFAAIADHLGLNITDLMCIGILDALGPITLGRLSTLTGLSSGSVTTLVDRMERTGLVRRVRDDADRRRVYLHLNHEQLAPLEQPYRLLNEAYWRFLDGFPPEQLEVVIDYLDKLLPFMSELTVALRERPTDEPDT
jgi:MarR family transcriptional regulator, organic hydroperoxide resistance regulator